MILWSSRTLERELAGGALSSWEKVKYLLLPGVIASLGGAFYVFRPVYGPEQPDLNKAFHVVFAVLTAYVWYRSVKGCWQENERADGEAFFERFAVLSLPPLIRVIVIAFAAAVSILIVTGLLKERAPVLFERAPILIGAIGPVGTYVIYTMVRASIRRHGELLGVTAAQNADTP